jgi:hypothetical protein
MNYHSTVMRALACVLLIPLCLVAQKAQSPKSFPIPEDMQEDWPGAGLNEAETKLLQKAVQADLLEVEADCETKLSLDRVEMVGVSLGKLGKAFSSECPVLAPAARLATAPCMPTHPRKVDIALLPMVACVGPLAS